MALEGGGKLGKTASLGMRVRERGKEGKRRKGVKKKYDGF